MYIKAGCPVCGSPIFHNLRIKYDKYRRFDGDIPVYRYDIKNIDVTDTLTEKELMKDVIQSLHRLIHDGIEVETVEGILKDGYGITGPCCKEFLEKITEELNLYSPDMKRLYFVESNCRLRKVLMSFFLFNISFLLWYFLNKQIIRFKNLYSAKTN